MIIESLHLHFLQPVGQTEKCIFYSSKSHVSKQGSGNLRIVHISLLKTKYCLSFICILRNSNDMTRPYKSMEKKTTVPRVGHTSIQDGHTGDIIFLWCFSMTRP